MCAADRGRPALVVDRRLKAAIRPFRRSSTIGQVWSVAIEELKAFTTGVSWK